MTENDTTRFPTVNITRVSFGLTHLMAAMLSTIKQAFSGGKFSSALALLKSFQKSFHQGLLN